MINYKTKFKKLKKIELKRLNCLFNTLVFKTYNAGFPLNLTYVAQASIALAQINLVLNTGFKSSCKRFKKGELNGN